MSGQQRRLIRIQMVMACVMIALSLFLIPSSGLVGAATAAALTNAVSNIWFLREVRQKLGLFPYNPSYLRLLPPWLASLGVLVAMRVTYRGAHSQWVVLGAALVLAYAVFLSVAFISGLDDDDRLVAQAAWSRVRGIMGN